MSSEDVSSVRFAPKSAFRHVRTALEEMGHDPGLTKSLLITSEGGEVVLYLRNEYGRRYYDEETNDVAMETIAFRWKTETEMQETDDV